MGLPVLLPQLPESNWHGQLYGALLVFVDLMGSTPFIGLSTAVPFLGAG